MKEFLTFRKFITPVAIQVLFWIAVVSLVITGLLTMGRGGTVDAIGGLLLIIIGPIVARIYMEVLIIIFRIYDVAHHLDHVLTGGTPQTVPTAPTGGAWIPAAPVTPPPAPPVITPPPAPPAVTPPPTPPAP